jgi:hypothetical protein
VRSPNRYGTISRGIRDVAESSWTVDTLKEHFTALREADQRSIVNALASADKASAKAEEASDKRYDGLNELRGAMRDQSTEFARTADLNAVRDQVNRLENAMASTSGRSGISTPIMLLIATAVGGLVLYVIEHIH